MSAYHMYVYVSSVARIFFSGKVMHWDVTGHALEMCSPKPPPRSIGIEILFGTYVSHGCYSCDDFSASPMNVNE